MAYSKIILNGETLMDVTSDTVAAGSLLSGKTATKNDGTKVTGNIANKTASDLTASGAIVTAAAGYYPSAVSKAVTTTTHPNPTATFVSSTGVFTATHAQTAGYVGAGTTTSTYTLIPKSSADLTINGQTFWVASGYYSSAFSTKMPTGTTSYYGEFTSSTGKFRYGYSYTSAGYHGNNGSAGGTFALSTVAAQTIYPSTAPQTIASYRWLTGSQIIAAMPVYEIYNEATDTSKLTAEKGTPARGEISIVPTLTVDSGGYISSGTYTGDFVNVDASELVNGTTTITSNGTYDVTYNAGVDVDVSATLEPAAYVTPNFDGGFYLPNSEVYVTSILDVPEEDWTEKYETDVLMTSSSMSYSTSTHESTATVILDNNISNGKGFFCILKVYYGELQQDYIWLWSDNITIGTTQLNFQSMFDLAIVKRALFTSANTLQIVFDWQNAYEGVQGVSDLFGNRFSSGVTINKHLSGARGIVVRPPSGTEQFTENGSYNVKWLETAEVNVPSGGGYTADDIAMRNISGEISGSASFIASSAFTHITTLTSIYFPNVTTIYSYAFYACQSLTSASLPAIVSIGANAFYACGLSIISFPTLTTISSYTFAQCGEASIINLPNLEDAGTGAFFDTSITSITLPKISIVTTNMFSGCDNLVSANFPEATKISAYAFMGCSQLTDVYIPKATIISTSAFSGCSKLSILNFPSLQTIGSSAFAGCWNLASVSVPEVTNVSASAFTGCSHISTISFPKVSIFNTYAFNNCTRLVELHLEEVSSVPILSTTYAFYYTPLFNYSTVARRWGSIFVPASLYNSFLTATNWSNASIKARIVSV